MPIAGVSFDDGLVSVEKLQRMCDNDDFLYNEVIRKPKGLVAIVERTSDYSNAAAPGKDSLFDDLVYTPIDGNRVLALWLFIPVYKSSALSAVASTLIHFQKDGIDMQYGSTDKKFHTNKADETSIFLCALDIKPKAIEHTYTVLLERHVTSGEQIIDVSTDRPAQFWVEDLGDASGV